MSAEGRASESANDHEAIRGISCNSWDARAEDILLNVVGMSKAHRLAGFDYSSNGGYFITICTHRRRALLIDECHAIANDELDVLPRRFDGLTVDCRMVMPDHGHAILLITECKSSVSVIVQAYKSITARRIKAQVEVERVWQRGFYDRIIRNEFELAALREYIQHNPIVHAARADRH